MANCIKRIVEDVLVDSKGPRWSSKETSRWNTKFQATIRFRERVIGAILDVGVMLWKLRSGEEESKKGFSSGWM